MSEIESLDAETVAEYLQRNPAFFDRYADLLNSVHIPSPHGGRAIALSDRQVQSLREKNRALEGKLGELIQFGEENDSISDRVHSIAVALVAADNETQVLKTVYEQLGLRLHVPHVALRMWDRLGDGREFDIVSVELREFAQKLERPYCGPNENFEAVAWFGDAAQVASIALIPLREPLSGAGSCVGMLALGSEEADRFYPDMGTLYLERLGELTAAALLRVF